MRRPPKDPTAARVLRRLNAVTPTIARAMFGGYGYYTEDGPIYAMYANGHLYFKADRESIREFEQEGGEPFVYDGIRGSTCMSYYSLPQSAWETNWQLKRWVGLAIDAAERGQQRKR